MSLQNLEISAWGVPLIATVPRRRGGLVFIDQLLVVDKITTLGG